MREQVVSLRWSVELTSILKIRISYVDTTLPTHIRQEELKEVYNFTCGCNLCSTSNADPREALWCPVGCGGMCLYPTEGMLSPAVPLFELTFRTTQTTKFLDAPNAKPPFPM